MVNSFKLRESKGDKLFYLVNGIIATVLFLIVLYPLIYIVSSSFSSPMAVTSGKVVLWPVDLSLEGYKAVFKDADVWIGYRNSAMYVVLGTTINLIVTILCAYPLSRKSLPGRNFFSFLFAFTMFFNGGMIPAYILVRSLHMMNTIWAVMIPGAMSVFNMIIVRTYFQTSIPESIFEASKIDGCNDLKYLSSILLPLSKPVIAVVTLYYAVGHWNAFFNAFLYLSDRKLMPLQLFLREILIMNTIDPNLTIDSDLMMAKQWLADLMKFSLIIVACVPMMILYPFIQQYFIKGVMIGSIKG